ncbi:hypothetical protein AB5J49_08020 [Streptomyces sp. R28]|uniref:DUF2637 domain-containing protein n=1 Tax=Streptomyces sp. R28 TaxID=3238628 RepID=A0AB39PVT2_9ACTN
MSSWREERRRDNAAEAEERRKTQAFQAQLRRDERRESKKERRDEKAQERRDKAARRQARAARREKTLTPGNVYRKGTLALVLASAAASLPAQIMHFAGISLMLLPIPFALEGAAWVMNAGVAYADERKLPAWVRWLMRGLAMSAAGYAARINLGYGLSLESHGLSAADAAAVGWGLAAVTMLGPLFFEVRQWVLTLTASTVDSKKQADEKARKKHEGKRYRDHKDVVKLARRLVSAAPFGTLQFEDAFASAWEIFYGTSSPCMTPALHAQQLASRQSLAAAMDEANGAPISARGRLLERLHPAPSALLSLSGSSQVATQVPPTSKRVPGGSQKDAPKGARTKPVPPVRKKGDTPRFHTAAKVAAADTARNHAAVNGHHH